MATKAASIQDNNPQTHRPRAIRTRKIILAVRALLVAIVAGGMAVTATVTPASAQPVPHIPSVQQVADQWTQQVWSSTNAVSSGSAIGSTEGWGNFGLIDPGRYGWAAAVTPVPGWGGATVVERAIFDEINAYRVSQGLAPATWSQRGFGEARAWGQELSRQSAFYHEPGINAFENLYFSAGRSPEAAIRAWKNSPGHHAVMLHDSLGEFGIAVVHGHYIGYPGWYVVLRGYY